MPKYYEGKIQAATTIYHRSLCKVMGWGGRHGFPSMVISILRDLYVNRQFCVPQEGQQNRVVLCEKWSQTRL